MKNFKIRLLLSALLLMTMYLGTGMTVLAQYECQPSSTLAPVTGSLTAGDATQTGRVVRDGRPSTCTGKTNALQNATAVNADQATFTSPVTGCGTITFDHTGCGTATTGIVVYSTYTPATPNTGVIGDMGFSSTGTGSFSFPVTASQNFTVVVYDVLETPTNLFCANYSYTISYSTSCRQAGFDTNNDGSAEMNLFRPSTGNWSAFNSNTGASVSTTNFGVSGDTPQIGDYSGDGNTDLGVFRSSNNSWFYRNGASTVVQPWGTAGDVPVSGDYDRDGKADVAIWRASNGSWYILQSSNTTLSVTQWGTTGDVPYTGDFDGDRMNDFGIVRTVSGVPQHLILESNFAQGFQLTAYFGVTGDKIVSGDYDGDAKTDVAVFRPSDGNWYISQSGVGTTIVTHWGQSGDIPQPADYDGDKKTDVAVYRPSNGAFYVLRSSDQQVRAFVLGNSTDVPASAPYSTPSIP